MQKYARDYIKLTVPLASSRDPQTSMQTIF